jgi:hypothetical protein
MLATGLSNRFLRFVHPRSRATVAVLASRFCRGGSSGDGNLGWWSSSSSSQRLMSSSPVVGEDRLASAAPFSCTFDPVPGAPIDTGPTSSGFDFTAEESVTVTDTGKGTLILPISCMSILVGQQLIVSTLTWFHRTQSEAHKYPKLRLEGCRESRWTFG